MGISIYVALICTYYEYIYTHTCHVYIYIDIDIFL